MINNNYKCGVNYVQNIEHHFLFYIDFLVKNLIEIYMVYSIYM
jgi:hypothetical protein